MKNKTFIIIPAYNEEERLGGVLEKIKKHCSNIIVIDDGSSDNTFKIAKKHKTIALRHRVNLGKGAALKTGCEAALSLGAQTLVFMDADGQHQPKDIPRFLRGIEKGYDLIFGLRRLSRAMPFSMLLGNKIFSTAISYFYNFQITDTQCGFRIFRSRVYPQIVWQAQGYDAETEIIAQALKNDLRCGAIFIDTVYHDRYKGTTVIDGIRVLSKIIGGRLVK